MIISNLTIPATREIYEWMQSLLSIHEKLIFDEISDEEVPIKFIFMDKYERQKLGSHFIDISFKNDEIHFECQEHKDIDFLIDLVQHLQMYKDVPQSIGLEYSIINTENIPKKIYNYAVIIQKDNIIHRDTNEDWIHQYTSGALNTIMPHL